MWAIAITFRLSSFVSPSTFHILIFSSETTEPIATKLWWNGPWVTPFQNYVRWFRLPTKMATKLKIEKRGMKFKKKSSLKLLSQFQPIFAEMILGWSPSKNVTGSSAFRPRWPPQCSCFYPGERLQAHGSFWFYNLFSNS